MKFIITLQVFLLGLLLIPSQSHAQRFFMDEAEVEAVPLTSDQFINQQGEITKKGFTVQAKVIDDELIQKNYFDKSNRLIGKRFYDHYGELYYDDYGVAIYEYTYDETGNRIEVKYFNEEKKPFQINFVGPAAIRYGYDDQNRINKVTYMNASGDLSASMGTSVIEYKYDEQNRIIEEKRLDDAEEAIDFFAPIIRYKYDEDSRLIEKSFHSEDGNLASRMLDEEDDPTAIIRLDYLGGEVIPSFFNKNNEKVLHQ